jgi:hypothetical protein
MILLLLKFIILLLTKYIKLEAKCQIQNSIVD